MSGPDSGRSWAIAAACCYINTMMFGMTRISGIMFVASVQHFRVTREQASFPYIVSNFTRNAAGPLVGFLGHKLGLRLVTACGAMIGAIGLAACFFAKHISSITILWGLVFGLGFGMGNILLPAVINQYFDKHRATATGISFSGACFGGFILPPIVEAIISTYGLSGTYLILSGLVLNCLPAAMLLRNPHFFDKPKKIQQDETTSIDKHKNTTLYTIEKNIAGTPLDRMDFVAVPRSSEQTLSYEERIKGLSTQTLLSNYSIRMSCPDVLDVQQIIENSKGRRQVDQDELDDEGDSQISNEDLKNEGISHFYTTSETERDILYGKVPSPNSNQFAAYRTFSDGSITRLPRNSITRQYSKSFNEAHSNKAYEQDETDVSLEKASNNATLCSDSYQDMSEETKSTLKIFSILFDPIFILVTLTNALYTSMFVCIITVIVDFAQDIGIETLSTKYILMSLSVGDLVGRLGLGWITDRGHMTRTGFASLCFLCQGVSTTAMTFSTGFPMLTVLSALYGLSEAGLIFTFPLIIAQYMRVDQQTVAISSSYFLSGPFCLAVAPLIGYFRDGIGSYVYLFYGVGVVSILCSLVYLFTPCFARCKKSSES